MLPEPRLLHVVASIDVSQENRRRGFWLRMARERANLSQEAVAALVGLSKRSKSTMSAWENGDREPKPTKLSTMARLYGVPVRVFTEPEPTAYERLDDLAHAAIALAREDRAMEEAPRPDGDGRRDGQPRTRQG